MGVVGAQGNLRGGGRQNADDGLDPELGAVVVDESHDYLCGRSHSAAKKAEAFLRISLARVASASSARSLRFSVSRSIDSAGVSVPDCLWVRTQTRRVSLACAEFVGDAGDRAPGGDGISLSVEHEFYSALLELGGVLGGRM